MCQNVALCGNGLQAILDDIIKVAQMRILVSDRMENIVGKGEIMFS